MTHGIDALKGVGVDDREVARRQTDYSLEHSPTRRLERAGAALPASESIAHGKECFRENESELTVLGRQVSISAGHRESVRIPDDWSDQDPYREVEIANHRFYDRNLLQVFLSEHGDVGHHNVK